MQRGDPLEQTRRAARSRLRREAFSILPQRCGRNTRCSSKLDGMSDEPALETAMANLGMELVSERVATQAERLIWAGLGRGKKPGPIRQVEGVAMPV